MKSVGDALTIRRRVFGAFEMAETTSDPGERQKWLTFALVGAGPTGVELAGQIRELATKTLTDEYRRANPGDARVLLFDGGQKPLAMFGDKLAAAAVKTLRELGVELHMGSMVTHVDGTGLTARDHDGNETHYDARTVLWTAGVEAPPIAAALATATGAERDRAGRIVVRDDLTIPGHPEISVIGDMMSLRKLPGVAEVAMQSGLYTGYRIRHELTGEQARGLVARAIGAAAAGGGETGRVQVPRPGLGRLHRARPRGRLGRAAAAERLPRLGRVAVRAHRVPDRLPQPDRRPPHLVGRLHPRRPPRARLHHREVGHVRDIYDPCPGSAAGRSRRAREQAARRRVPRSRPPYPVARAGVREEDACPPTRS